MPPDAVREPRAPQREGAAGRKGSPSLCRGGRVRAGRGSAREPRRPPFPPRFRELCASAWHRGAASPRHRRNLTTAGYGAPRFRTVGRRLGRLGAPQRPALSMTRVHAGKSLPCLRCVERIRAFRCLYNCWEKKRNSLQTSLNLSRLFADADDASTPTESVLKMPAPPLQGSRQAACAKPRGTRSAGTTPPHGGDEKTGRKGSRGGLGAGILTTMCLRTWIMVVETFRYRSRELKKKKSVTLLCSILKLF